MADGIRELMIQALLTRLAAITKANGYETDIGLNVYRGLSVPLETDDLPAIIANECEETTNDEKIVTTGQVYLFLVDLDILPYSYIGLRVDLVLYLLIRRSDTFHKRLGIVLRGFRFYVVEGILLVLVLFCC